MAHNKRLIGFLGNSKLSFNLIEPINILSKSI